MSERSHHGATSRCLLPRSDLDLCQSEQMTHSGFLTKRALGKHFNLKIKHEKTYEIQEGLSVCKKV